MEANGRRREAKTTGPAGKWREEGSSGSSQDSNGSGSGSSSQSSGRGGGYRKEKNYGSSGRPSPRGSPFRETRSGGGYRGGGSGGGPPPKYVANPDPYNGDYSSGQIEGHQQIGWKPFSAKKEDVIIHQYGNQGEGERSKLTKKNIRVAVNHFAIKSNAGGASSFPIPNLYHYDISYEMCRKSKSGVGSASAGSSPMTKKRKEDGKDFELDLSQATISLQGSSLIEEDNKKKNPVNKKLPKYLTNMILKYLIPKVRQNIGNHAVATDGCFNLYSTKKLIGDSRVVIKHSVTFAELRHAGILEENEEGTVIVGFLLANAIDSTALAAGYRLNGGTLRGKQIQLSSELRQTLESACNAFVKSFPNFDYFSVGRSTMVRCDQDADGIRKLGGGVAAWRGMSAHIAMGWKPYLNVDIANCAMLLDTDDNGKPKPVMEIIKEVVGCRHTDNVDKWSDQEFAEVKGLLTTCKVQYKVDGKKLGGSVTEIGGQSVKNAKFQWEEKKKRVSVLEYYKQRYGIVLKHPNGPVLLIRKKAMVPAELCVMKRGQSYNRKLDGKQTTEMLNFAKRDPKELENDILSQINGMQLNQNPVLKDLGIQIASEMLTINARVLVPPTLRYGSPLVSKGKEGLIAHITPEGGSWEIWKNDFSFYKTVNITKWGVLVVGCPKIRDESDSGLKVFISALKINGDKKNVSFVDRPSVVVDKQCRVTNTPEQNRLILKQLLESRFYGCQLVVVVIPMKGTPLYGYVKHAAEIDVGLLTQCVTEKSVTSCKDSTVQNILLKINSKLGGVNHVTVSPLNESHPYLITDCPLLVLGADVTHAPPGYKKFVNGKEFVMPSYAAVTGSLDKTCMPYMTEVRAQRKANGGAAEVIQDLQEIVKTMIKSFVSHSGLYPRKIIYFRDGVGEGQFPEVLHVEMTAIRNACKEISTVYQPKITFITVQKRHKTRIFYHSASGKTENAPAGTVIDTEIVHPSEADFYLLSHKGMLGTSRPSRYHVLWDDSDFNLDVLQSLAFTLCHMYVRCTKSVKMPAPTYYAHLAADRAKKLCEGFEDKGGQYPTEENLNVMLRRHSHLTESYPMHFV